jgi:GNAT superfamily N-acetyltransferase
VSEIIVRKAVFSDLPYLYELCLKTGYQGKDATDLFSDPYIMGNYYVAPYLSYPDGINFVAEYNHKPHGYIVDAPNTDLFNQWMEENWLPPLRKRYPLHLMTYRSEYEKEIIGKIHEKHFPVDHTSEAWYKNFPSELHINLNPNIHRKGIGRIFMNKVFEELKQQRIPGVNIGVGIDNSNAFIFYQKMGFSVLAKAWWGYIMGKII